MGMHRTGLQLSRMWRLTRAGRFSRVFGTHLLATSMALAVSGAVLGGCAGSNKTEINPNDATALYNRALNRQERGDCAGAMPDLERLAGIGRGWELAQVTLAECVLETSSDTGRALSLVTLAAQSNNSKAQATLSRFYLDGVGVAADPLAAGQWYLLSQKSAIEGLGDSNTAVLDLRDRLNDLLSAADWAEAQIRADAWSPDYQPLNRDALLRRPGSGSGPGSSGPGYGDAEQSGQR